jgi:hypothetical protein
MGVSFRGTGDGDAWGERGREQNVGLAACHPAAAGACLQQRKEFTAELYQAPKRLAYARGDRFAPRNDRVVARLAGAAGTATMPGTKVVPERKP